MIFDLADAVAYAVWSYARILRSGWYPTSHYKPGQNRGPLGLYRAR